MKTYIHNKKGARIGSVIDDIVRIVDDEYLNDTNYTEEDIEYQLHSSGAYISFEWVSISAWDALTSVLYYFNHIPNKKVEEFILDQFCAASENIRMSVELANEDEKRVNKAILLLPYEVQSATWSTYQYLYLLEHENGISLRCCSDMDIPMHYELAMPIYNGELDIRMGRHLLQPDIHVANVQDLYSTLVKTLRAEGLNDFVSWSFTEENVPWDDILKRLKKHKSMRQVCDVLKRCIAMHS